MLDLFTSTVSLILTNGIFLSLSTVLNILVSSTVIYF